MWVCWRRRDGSGDGGWDSVRGIEETMSLVDGGMHLGRKQTLMMSCISTRFLRFPLEVNLPTCGGMDRDAISPMPPSEKSSQISVGLHR